MKQNKPQYGHKNYGQGDKQKKAKPVGYRYKNVDKKSKLYYKTPSDSLIKKFEKGDEDARNKIYFERRKDHSDVVGRRMRNGGEFGSWEGTDVNLEISLEEYVFVARHTTKDYPDEYQIVYKIQDDNYGVSYVREKFLNDLINGEEWADEGDVNSFLSFVGMSKEEWLDSSFVMKLSDTIQYWGHENVLGTEYHPNDKKWAYEFVGIEDSGDYAKGGKIKKVREKYKIILGKEVVQYDTLDELIDDFEDKYSRSEKLKAEIVYGSDLMKPKGEIRIKYAKGGGVGEVYDTDAFKTREIAKKNEQQIKEYFGDRLIKSEIVFGKDNKGQSGFQVKFELKPNYAKGGGVGELEIGSEVEVELNNGKIVKGKVEKTNPLKIRTDATSTQVIPNALIKNVKQYGKGGGVKKRSLMSVAYLVVDDWRKESIKDWYTKNYPTDDLGEKLNDITFADLWNANNEDNIYDVIGVGDSLIRERLFERLSWIYGVNYKDVYDRLFSSKYAKGGGVGEFDGYDKFIDGDSKGEFVGGVGGFVIVDKNGVPDITYQSDINEFGEEDGMMYGFESVMINNGVKFEYPIMDVSKGESIMMTHELKEPYRSAFVMKWLERNGADNGWGSVDEEKIKKAYQFYNSKEYAKGGGVGEMAYVVNYVLDIDDIDENADNVGGGTIVVVATNEEEATENAYKLVGGFDSSEIADVMTIEQAEKMGLKPVKYNNGGGVRSSNKDSRSLVQSRTDFNANNLSGENIGDTYVVKSYGYYPVFVYKNGKWYENSNKYSKSTAKQMGQARPTSETELVSTDELKAMYEFEDGGSVTSELQSIENTIHNSLSSGEKVSVELVTMYLGRKPSYEEKIVGYRIRKCYLQPYFKRID